MPTIDNAIVLENQKPGAPRSDWMLQPGKASDNIEGFTTSMSTNVGNTVDFKIKAKAANYTIQIYRLGYYGGDGATLVTTLNHTGASAGVQPAPLTDPTTGLVDCGNWNVTDSWNVPQTATSGVYVAKLVAQDGSGNVSEIPFVVTNNASTSDIVYQTSDQTWQAYNAWGGDSLYTGQQAVSYNRPIDTPARPNATTVAGPWDYVFGEELPAISWLEQNGYDVTYQSGIDTSTNGAPLLNHKVFLSVGHDEYWNAAQRNAVAAARDAGVSLDFWSGNEGYWATELQPSIAAGGGADRTLVSYKTTHTGLANPDGTWTGEWRDPAGGGLAENSLSGQLFLVDWGFPPLARMTVGSQYAQLQIWRNTAVAALQTGQTFTTAGKYLGYEWDVNATSNALANNGQSPAGLVPLSSTTVQTQALDANYLGLSLTTGAATNNLTLYRAASGALVFGAGTVMWPWALSSLHTHGPRGAPRNDPTDPAIQQAMVNLLADQGVQPQTLVPSLTLASPSTDKTPPTTTITSDTTSPVTAGQPTTVTGVSVDLGGGVVAAVEVSTDGGNTWHDASFSAAASSVNWTYTWTPTVSGATTILARATDDSANLEHPMLNANFAVTDFNPHLSLSEGWGTADQTRMLADVNGDGKSDLIGVSAYGVYVMLGQGNEAQYNGGASLSSTVDQLLPASAGYDQTTQRGVDYVGNFTNSPSDHFATIWGVGADGLHYNVATGSTSATDAGGVAYQTPIYEATPRVYPDFGLAQGWTDHNNVQTAFLSTSDAFASIVGFGDTGVWVATQAFSPSPTPAYIAAGSNSLGDLSGWDSTHDVRTLLDYNGKPIDLNGDGVPDFVGMGPTGLEYAMGQYSNGQYSLGPIQTPQTGVDFGRDQGWDNTTNVRMIADIMGNGHEDIIGFGDAGVWVSMGQTPHADGSGAFSQTYLASENFGANLGWNLAQDTFALGDVYGNGKLDIIGFGSDNTFIASPSIDPATGHILFTTTDVIHAYGFNEGFMPTQNFRSVADISGTGIASILASAATNTNVASFV